MTAVNEALARRERLKASSTERLSRMLEIRYFEDRVRELFAEGMVIGTTHTVQGQEAVSIGISTAARPTDMIAATYRSHGIALALGMTPLVVMAEILGRTAGSVGGVGGSMHLCDISVGLLPTMAIVGAGIPVAAGAALTAQVKGTDDAAIAIFGDGASNIGAFHEGINLAAIWKLPVVFICENNLYGEYSPIKTTTAIDDIASRAASYGIPGVIVDGQDVDVVHKAVDEALAHARSGAGPILLEMKTYRFAGHSRADTGPYRPEGELDRWLERDPIKLYTARLIENGDLTEADVDGLTDQAKAMVEETVEQSLASPVPDVSAMFTNIYGSG